MRVRWFARSVSKKHPSHAETTISTLHRRGGAPDAAAGHPARSGGAGLDDHGDCGHDDGWAADSQRRGHRSGKPWQHSFQRSSDIRNWVDAGARYARLTLLWSRRCRGLSPLSCEWGIPELRNHAFSDGNRVAVRARTPLARYSSIGAESGDSISARIELGHTSAFALLCISPLSPGHEPGQAGDVRADFRKFRKPRRE